MKTIEHRGTRINKIDINNYAEALEILDLDFMSMWLELGDGESDFIYVSNGFLGLLNNPENLSAGEWHHYFKKNDEGFECFKFSFSDERNTYGI